jgi:NAD(P)-dependent dehydrogenase (short-subunit alcohol dehydrogenase family)
MTLDVTDAATVAQARERIEREFGHLDVPVNNAGVSLERERRPPSETPVDVVRRTYETNLFGTIAVTNAMLDLLRRSPAARIVNISTTMGSNAIWSDPDSQQRRFAPLLLAYDSSKAALNAATVHYAIELKDTAVKVNAASPGYVATDLNSNQGQLAVEDEDSVAAVVRLATLARPQRGDPRRLVAPPRRVRDCVRRRGMTEPRYGPRSEWRAARAEPDRESAARPGGRARREQAQDRRLEPDALHRR